LKLSGGSWQTSTGSAFHRQTALGKKVCVGSVLYLPVSGFGSSGENSSWLQVSRVLRILSCFKEIGKKS